METKRPDAIVTDLDGTLLGPDKQVGERDAAAIRRLTRLGIPVVPGTGRPIFGIGHLMEELGLELAGGSWSLPKTSRRAPSGGWWTGCWKRGYGVCSTPPLASTAPRG